MHLSQERGMEKHRFALVVSALLLSTSALADEIKREAVIISISDGTINARTREGPLTVLTSPSTKITEGSKERDAKSLIPGLIFTVKGEQQGDAITASSIKFKERDWRAAIAAKAGTTEQLAELRQAVIDGQEYVIREETTVYFASGKSNIADQYKQNLHQLAQKAPSFGNYRISLLGFTDPRGNPEANERLSMQRAMAVSNYIRQTGLIQPGRVLSPSAMGEGTTAPGEAAPTSDDEARRVVVRVITPKGQLTQ
jgi:outer membrane protein OmpA-like peptidoglycan-associated protein